MKKKLFDNNKLLEFRKKNNYTQKEIAEKLQISTVTYQHWEMGTREPKKNIDILTTVIKSKGENINDFYKYDVVKKYNVVKENVVKKKFNGTLLATLRKNLNLGQGDLAEILGIHSGTISKWERGIQTCSEDNAKKLSIIFEIDKEKFFSEGN